MRTNPSDRLAGRGVLGVLIAAAMLFPLAGASLGASGGSLDAVAASATPTPSTSPTTTAVRIQLLNPSDYDANPATPLVISDKETPKDASYRLNAWAANAPSQSAVEFELFDGVRTITIGTATRIGADTFSYNWVIPDTIPDGQYTLRAVLYVDSGSGLEEASRDEAPVVIRQGAGTPAAPAADFVYPGDEGQVGIYTIGEASNLVADVAVSAGTTRVRVFYTKSKSGTEPEWVLCGTQSAAAAAGDGIRCNLAAGDAPTAVTGLAVVANETPSGQTTQSAFDGAGDAIRVFPYAQVPAAAALNISPVRYNSTDGAFPCTDPIVAVVRDQFGRKIAGANVDVHAQGPTDNVAFDTGELTAPDALQPPDKNHSGTEPGHDCSGAGVDQLVGLQAEHNVALAPDRKHVESVGGTDDGGTWSFSLHSDARGTTQLVAWADANDDDVQQTSEAAAFGSVGWNEDPQPPPTQLLIEPETAMARVATCQRFVVSITGGAPSGSPTVDVHITGPDASVTFCNPGDATASQPPDQGPHSGNAEADGSGTLHIEGRPDANDRFVFGVSSGSPGATEVFAWLDTAEDDLYSNEPNASAEMSSSRGGRTISIDRSRGRVARGHRARIFGVVEGDEGCTAGELVKLKSRRPGARFRTIKRTTTADDGGYSFRVRVWRTKEYRTVAPATSGCERAKSEVVRIRRKR